MFNSNVLEVGIGLVFTFLTVSLICGVLTEAVATILSWRAKTLLTGIQKLVNDPKFTGLAQALYQNSLVHPLGVGGGQVGAARWDKPAYVDPKQFVQALLDTISLGETEFAKIKTAIESNKAIQDNPQLKQLFGNLLAKTNQTVDNLKQDLGSWFDAAMDRVSGTYKRWTQLFCFLFGLAVAVGLNVDTLAVARAIWLNPEITKAIGEPKQDTDAEKALNALSALPLPIGWSLISCPLKKEGTTAGAGAEFGPPRLVDLRPSAGREGQHECRFVPWSEFTWQTLCSAAWLHHLPGWIITALSTLFGASFWFDALANLIKLRGNGPKPPAASKPTT